MAAISTNAEEAIKNAAFGKSNLRGPDRMGPVAAGGNSLRPQPFLKN